MEYMNRFLIRPATGGQYAIFKVNGENRVEKFYAGTKAECSEGYTNLATFYGDLCRYCRDNFTLEKGKATYSVVVAMSHKEGVNPPIYQAKLDMDVDSEHFFDLIISDMREAGYNPANPDTKVDHIVYIGYKHGLGEDYHGRHPFVPTEGLEYENAGGGMYECLFNGMGYSLMRSVASSWTFKAYDIVIDDKGQIEWAHSECGRFEKPGEFSRFQKQLIYEELRLEYAVGDVRNHLKEKADWYTLLQEKAKSDSVEFHDVFSALGDPADVFDVIEHITDEDMLEMAQTFLDDHDCSIADNDQWEYIVDSFIQDRLKAVEGGAA